VASPRPGRYDEQARTYDRTRGASPTVVRLLAAHLGVPVDRSLLDIAGGTGNYARAMQERGFHPVVIDAAEDMARMSIDKIGPGRQLVGDAGRLPIRDGSFDCAMCVVAIHLFADRPAAFGKARRVLRGGPFLVVAYTRENLAALFVNEYFGGGWPGGDGFGADQIVDEMKTAGFSRVQAETFVYSDTVGGSLVAMHTDAALLADPEHLKNTSYWHRLPEHVREAGLARLTEHLHSGVLQRRVAESLRIAQRTGHGTVFVANP
jgi:SAM-dependent methyltransferase